MATSEEITRLQEQLYAAQDSRKKAQDRCEWALRDYWSREAQRIRTEIENALR